MRDAMIRWPLMAALAALVGCGSAQPNSAAPSLVLDASELEWTALNPARGAASPMAATLWGDRAGAAPTGFLVRFVDGFRSPPHIHNVSYRGVVVGGQVHNAHPDAPDVWMPVGAFWTQPKGHNHVTAAKGVTTAFIEIDEGPYLVRPVDQAFDSGERAVNLAPEQLTWTPGPGGATASKVAPARQLIRLPAGASLTVTGQGLRAVVIEGAPSIAGRPRAPGSAAHADGAPIALQCGAKPCLLFLRADGPVSLR